MAKFYQKKNGFKTQYKIDFPYPCIVNLEDTY